MKLIKSFKHLLFLHIIIATIFTCTFLNSVTVNAQDITVLPTTSDWDYFHPTDATDPALADADYNTTWFTQNDPGNIYDGPAFADTGSGLFGYGTINFGPITENIGTPPGGSRYTAYFTTTFDLTGIDVSTIEDITANLLSDDGAFIYLNGQLAGELNMGAVADTYMQFASGVGNEAGLTTVDLDHTLLIDGINTIAVSVHQVGVSSSDLGFQLEAVATIRPVPEPSTMLLCIIAVVCGLWWRKRR